MFMDGGKRWKKMEKDGKRWKKMEKDGKRWKKMEKDSFQQPKKERSWGPMCSNVVHMWSTCLRSSSGCNLAISPGWRGAESRCSSAERTAEPEIRCLVIFQAAFPSHSAATQQPLELMFDY